MLLLIYNSHGLCKKHSFGDGIARV